MAPASNNNTKTQTTQSWLVHLLRNDLCPRLSTASTSKSNKTSLTLVMLTFMKSLLFTIKICRTIDTYQMSYDKKKNF